MTANPTGLDRFKALSALIGHVRAETYLEIGVEFGRVFLNIRAPRKIGVDPHNACLPKLLARGVSWHDRSMVLGIRWNTLLGRERTYFFEMTSDEFFRRNSGLFARGQIDVALVDGEHTCEQAYRDVQNCLRFLSPHGVILMHDCRPVTAAHAVRAASLGEAQLINRRVPDWDGAWCGDVWKAIPRLRARPDLQVFVLDCDMGLGVVTRGAPENLLPLSGEELDSLSFSDYEKNRDSLLNLKPESYFYDFLRAHPRR